MLLDAMPTLPRHPRTSLAAAQAGSLCYRMRCLDCPVIPACRWRLHRLEAYATGCDAWTAPSSPHVVGGCTGWKPMLLGAMLGLPRHLRMSLAVAQAGSLCYLVRCLDCPVIPACRWRLHRLEAYATWCDAWTAPSSPHVIGGCTGWKPMLPDAMLGPPRHLRMSLAGTRVMLASRLRGNDDLRERVALVARPILHARMSPRAARPKAAKKSGARAPQRHEPRSSPVRRSGASLLRRSSSPAPSSARRLERP